MKKYIDNYFEKIKLTIEKIDCKKINKLANSILKIRRNKGRIFFLGVGGSAGNCSHAVNDFRKLCDIECYTPMDNVSELSARINDNGWNSSLSDWLKVSKLNKNDAIFILSVGGGNKKAKVSINLIKAIDLAIKRKVKIFGIIGKENGYAYLKGDNVILIPKTEKKLITPLSESFQSIILHCLVTHPLLQSKSTKW
tara:strand:- start:258 stop:845 length:588 start_codon:yes stop_codon:yes gene_type:complete